VIRACSARASALDVAAPDFLDWALDAFEPGAVARAGDASVAAGERPAVDPP